MHGNSRSSLNFNNIVKSQLLCFNEAGSIIKEQFCLEVENNENIKPLETFSFLELPF